MGYIFVGGSGRSGTSALARCIAVSYEEHLSSFEDIELKLFNESGGITDLYHASIDSYNANRLKERVDEFRLKYYEWLICENVYGQTAVSNYLDRAEYELAVNNFLNNFSISSINTLDEEKFIKISKELIDIFFKGKKHFLEKTPHLILEYKLLNKIFDNSLFISVLRNPSATFLSMKKFAWGFEDDNSRFNWINKYYRVYNEIRKNFRDNVLEVFIEDPNIFLKANEFISQKFSIDYFNADFDYDTLVTNDIYYEELKSAHEIYNSIKLNL